MKINAYALEQKVLSRIEHNIPYLCLMIHVIL
jgi:hypothetical protein